MDDQHKTNDVGTILPMVALESDPDKVKDDNKLSKEELAVLKQCYKLLLRNATKTNKVQNKIEDADEFHAPEASPIPLSITTSDDSVSLHENVENANTVRKEL